MADCTGCECCNTQEASISLKFNSGDPALLYRGTGLEPIRTFGLHTDYELETERAKTAKLRAALQELVAVRARSPRGLRDTDGRYGRAVTALRETK